MAKRKPADARLSRRLQRARAALQWEDVAACASVSSSSSAAVSLLTSLLPLSLLRDRVFQYVAPTPSFDGHHLVRRHGIYLKAYAAQLAPLQTVCQQWHSLAEFVLKETTKRVCTVAFESDTAVETSRILKRAKREGRDVEQLALVTKEIIAFVGPYHTPKTLNFDKLCDPEWWDAFFACFPNLQRLDLSRLALACTPVVLAAAASHCHNVRALELRWWGSRMAALQRGEPVMQAIAELERALAVWHGATGGLRTLTIPFWVAEDAAYNAFLRAVTRHCPKIEHLLSSMVNQHETPAFVWYEPSVSTDVWADFCGTCVELQSFSWSLAPLSKETVGHFLTPPKPKLESLEITNSSHSQWWEGMDDLTSITSLVAQSPLLRYFSLSLARVPFRIATASPTMDAIVRTVAQFCPAVEACRFRYTTSFEVAHVITSSALVELSRSTALRFLDAINVSLEDQTLVDIFKNMRVNLPGKRYIDIVVADFAHSAILNLLKYIGQQPATWCSNTILEVFVTGYQEEATVVAKSIPANQSVRARGAIKKLVDGVIRKHSSSLSYLRVGMQSLKVGGRQVECIVELDLLMNASASRVDGGYADEDENGERSLRGGVFDVREWTMRETEAFDIWDRTVR